MPSRHSSTTSSILYRELTQTTRSWLRSTLTPISVTGHLSPALVNELALQITSHSSQNRRITKNRTPATDSEEEFEGPEFDGFASGNEENELSFDPFDESNDLACTALADNCTDGFSDPKAFSPRQACRAQPKYVNLLMDRYCGIL